METQEVAEKLIEYCRNGEYDKAHAELYHADIVSVERTPKTETIAKGMDAKKKKVQEWNDMVETIHSDTFSEPVVSANSFAVVMKTDASDKEGNRFLMNELAVYMVKDGKIIYEEFFYPDMK